MRGGENMSERLKHMKETLMSAVESQMYNLSDVDAEELGEVVDMIKDLEEATYYCAVVKAMEEAEERNKKEGHSKEMYYTPMYYPMHYGNGSSYYMEREGNTDGRDMPRRYYNGSGTSSMGGSMSSNSSSSQYSNGNGSGSSSQYSEREFPQAFQDSREGRSPRSRRMYMEAKETHQDKTTQMKELEKYAQELTQDIIEMVEGASQEERQYLSKKVTALANKITQING